MVQWFTLERLFDPTYKTGCKRVKIDPEIVDLLSEKLDDFEMVVRTPKLSTLLPIKCLTLRQPWAWAVVTGLKDVENRSWKTEYRGPLLIHAAKGKPEKWAYDAMSKALGRKIPALDEMVRGAVVGRVNVIDCVTKYKSGFFFGPYGFVLDDAVEFKTPIDCLGRLGFFTLSQALK